MISTWNEIIGLKAMADRYRSSAAHHGAGQRHEHALRVNSATFA